MKSRLLGMSAMICFAAASEGGGASVTPSSLSKMTTKTLKINGPKLAASIKVGEIVWAGQIFGRCKDLKIKKRISDSGELMEDHPIIGTFEGVNLETGEVSQSSILYLPGGFHDVLESAMKAANGGVVDFATEIGVQRVEDVKDEVRYNWVAKNLRKPSGADELASLRAEMASSKNASKPNQLAAPAAGAKK